MKDGALILASMYGKSDSDNYKSKVSRDLGISVSYVINMFNLLEKNGLIKKTDRVFRKCGYTLTKKGRKVAENILDIIEIM